MVVEVSIQTGYSDPETAVAQKQHTQKMLVRILSVAQLLMEATQKGSAEKIAATAQIVEKTQH